VPRTKSASVANRRPSGMKWCEIVRVDSPLLLISSRQHACRYETADGGFLANGYYLALSPVGTYPSYYGRELRYIGPLATRTEAQLLQTSALWMGIADLEVNGDHTAFPFMASKDRSRLNLKASPVQEAPDEEAGYQGA